MTTATISQDVLECAQAMHDKLSSHGGLLVVEYPVYADPQRIVEAFRLDCTGEEALAALDFLKKAGGVLITQSKTQASVRLS